MTQWKTQWGGRTVAKTKIPGVWKLREGGFLIRGSVKDPRTKKLREVFQTLPDVRDERAALVILENAKDSIRAGSDREKTTCPSFKDYALSLFEQKRASGDHRSAATTETWRHVLEVRLAHAPFADYCIDTIRTADILEWQAGVKIGKGEGEYSPHTANVWLRVLRAIINAAVIKYELERNPMLAIKPWKAQDWRGKITKEQPNSLRPAEVPLFLDKMRELHPDLYAFTCLGFAIGARPSSLRPLRRRGVETDVDLERGELELRRSHTIGTAVREANKNAIDVSIPLPPALVEILKWHVATYLSEPDPKAKDTKRQAARAKSDLLFPSRVGGFLSSTMACDAFRDVSLALCEEIDGKIVTPKGMRRTNKDLMRAAGVSNLVAMAVSNHEDEGMHRHYSTAATDEKRDAVAKVVSLFRRAG